MELILDRGLGIDWWEADPMLSSKARREELNRENAELRARLAALDEGRTESEALLEGRGRTRAEASLEQGERRRRREELEDLEEQQEQEQEQESA